MKRLSILIILLCFFCGVEAQQINYLHKDIQINEYVEGTLLKPLNKQSFPLVIFVAGSGPTDRNGNQKHIKTDCFKQLAEAISEKNVATFRYDKRIIKQLQNKDFKEEDISFDDFVTDAKAVVAYFKRNPQYTKVYIAGHSQGSLVGMLASEENVDGFISLAGAGQSIDKVLEHQIENTAPTLLEDARTTLATLKKGKTTNKFNELLAPIFRKSIQPFMISWMKYDPVVEIKKLDIPVLIINGDKDLQVPESEANLLHEAKPEAEFKIISNMNHVLKEISGEGKLDTNAISYRDPKIPLSDDLVETILNFIK